MEILFFRSCRAWCRRCIDGVRGCFATAAYLEDDRSRPRAGSRVKSLLLWPSGFVPLDEW